MHKKFTFLPCITYAAVFSEISRGNDIPGLISHIHFYNNESIFVDACKIGCINFIKDYLNRFITSIDSLREGIVAARDNSKFDVVNVLALYFVA